MRRVAIRLPENNETNYVRDHTNTKQMQGFDPFFYFSYRLSR